MLVLNTRRKLRLFAGPDRARFWSVEKCLHLNSNEAMNLLSLMRLAVDLEMLPEVNRSDVDRLFIECQPGHIQYVAGEGIEPDARGLCRAKTLRQEFAQLPHLILTRLTN